MTLFVKSDQVITDLMATLNGQSTVSQQLKEALGRNSNCDYEQQIVSSLDSGVGNLPDTVRSLRLPDSETSLPSAKRYFLNDRSANAGTAKHSFSFGTETTLGTTNRLTLSNAPTRDLITSHKAVNREYTIDSQHNLNFAEERAYLVNVRLSMIVYDGQTKPGVGHPAPSFFGMTNQELEDIDSAIIVGSNYDVKPVFFNADGGLIEPENLNTAGWVLANRIRDFHVIESNHSFKFTAVNYGFGIPYVAKAAFNLHLNYPCCVFGSREQHIGLFKKLQAGDKYIDSSNYIDVICLGTPPAF